MSSDPMAGFREQMAALHREVVLPMVKKSHSIALGSEPTKATTAALIELLGYVEEHYGPDPRIDSIHSRVAGYEAMAEAVKGMKEMNAERCGWNEDADGVWESDCGASFVFTEGGSLDEHEFRFCHSCGKRIEEVRYGVERDEEKA